MNGVHLNSRLPQIAAQLEPWVNVLTKRVATAVEQGAKGRAPVGTGALRDSIHVEQQGESAYAVVAGDHDVFYGHMVEHGTTAAPPHPFLVPALEEARPLVAELAKEALRRL